jgi:hypothetical protein
VAVAGTNNNNEEEEEEEEEETHVSRFWGRGMPFLQNKKPQRERERGTLLPALRNPKPFRRRRDERGRASNLPPWRTTSHRHRWFGGLTSISS